MTDRQILDLIRSSIGYKTTVGAVDKSKVQKALEGKLSLAPKSNLGRAAWELAKRVAGGTPPPPPPPPPPAKLAPQTYNKGSSGQDARYNIYQNTRQIAATRWQDEGGFQYDEKGLCLGGRSGQYIPQLKPADQMDGKEPWEPYNGMPPWPAKSYEV